MIQVIKKILNMEQFHRSKAGISRKNEIILSKSDSIFIA